MREEHMSQVVDMMREYAKLKIVNNNCDVEIIQQNYQTLQTSNYTYSKDNSLKNDYQLKLPLYVLNYEDSLDLEIMYICKCTL